MNMNERRRNMDRAERLARDLAILQRRTPPFAEALQDGVRELDDDALEALICRLEDDLLDLAMDAAEERR